MQLQQWQAIPLGWTQWHPPGSLIVIDQREVKEEQQLLPGRQALQKSLTCSYMIQRSQHS